MDAKGWYEGGGIGVLIKSWCYGWCYGCGDLGMVVGGGGMVWVLWYGGGGVEVWVWMWYGVGRVGGMGMVMWWWSYGGGGMEGGLWVVWVWWDVCGCMGVLLWV